MIGIFTPNIISEYFFFNFFNFPPFIIVLPEYNKIQFSNKRISFTYFIQ